MATEIFLSKIVMCFPAYCSAVELTAYKCMRIYVCSGMRREVPGQAGIWRRAGGALRPEGGDGSGDFLGEDWEVFSCILFDSWTIII